MGVAPTYRSRSVSARLAAALLAAEGWLREVGLHDAGVQELIDHLWEWPTVDEAIFDRWHAFDSEVLRLALGGPRPTRLNDLCRAAGAPAEELDTLLTSLVEMVEGNLFAAVNDEATLAELERVEAVSAGRGIALVSADHFSDQRFADRHGWGKRAGRDDLLRWRALG